MGRIAFGRNSDVRTALCAFALIGSGIIGTSTKAEAASVTSNLTVAATVGGTCTLGGVAMSFGTYAPTAASTASSAIQISCNTGTSATVGLSQGSNNNRVPASGTRALASDGKYLGYDIYMAASYLTVWNSTNVRTINFNTGAPITLTAFGRIPAGQNPGPGSYIDTVTITVTF